jgi:hypothetical protein
VGKLDDAMDAGDARGLLREWVRGPIQAEARGEFCECEEPDLTGRKSPICFRCDRYNLKRRAEIEAALEAPHPFEPMGDDQFRSQFCDFCARGKADYRHQ